MHGRYIYSQLSPCELPANTDSCWIPGENYRHLTAINSILDPSAYGFGNARVSSRKLCAGIANANVVYLLFFWWNQLETILPQGSPELFISLSLSPLHAQKSSGSRLQQTPAITDLYYGHLSLLVPTAQFYCSSKSRYNGHQLAFFSVTSLQNLLIMIHSFNRGFAVRNPYVQKMP